LVIAILNNGLKFLKQNLKTVFTLEICYKQEKKLSKEARVKLSTIHSAKGGEADNVLLILDNTKTIREAIEKSPDKEDEENRIWYVGVTRTKQNLYIMAAKKEDKGYDIESIQ
jgi:superfamily I DNA/RNA helicase